MDSTRFLQISNFPQTMVGCVSEVVMDLFFLHLGVCLDQLIELKNASRQLYAGMDHFNICGSDKGWSMFKNQAYERNHSNYI